MPVWLTILVASISIISTIGSIVAIVISRLSKGNFAEFKLEILKIIDEKLDSFVKKSELQTYSESHGREHKDMNDEISKLRSFRHDVGAEIRKLGSRVEDNKEVIKEIKQDIKDERKDGYTDKK